MEWDRIAEKWGQMALRMRNDGPTGCDLFGATRTDEASGTTDGEADAGFGQGETPPRPIPAETSPMARNLKSGQ